MSGRRIGVGRGAVAPIEGRYRASVQGTRGPLADVCARADRDGTRRHVLGHDGVRAHDASSSEREAVALLRDDARAGTDRDAVLDDDAHARAGMRGACGNGDAVGDLHAAAIIKGLNVDPGS